MGAAHPTSGDARLAADAPTLVDDEDDVLAADCARHEAGRVCLGADGRVARAADFEAVDAALSSAGAPAFGGDDRAANPNSGP